MARGAVLMAADWDNPRPAADPVGAPPFALRETVPPGPPPAWRDPSTWRLNRVWQFWLLAMLTLGAACLAFGPDRVAAGIHDAWPFELRSDARP